MQVDGPLNHLHYFSVLWDVQKYLKNRITFYDSHVSLSVVIKELTFSDHTRFVIKMIKVPFYLF